MEVVCHDLPENYQRPGLGYCHQIPSSCPMVHLQRQPIWLKVGICCDKEDILGTWSCKEWKYWKAKTTYHNHLAATMAPTVFSSCGLSFPCLVSALFVTCIEHLWISLFFAFRSKNIIATASRPTLFEWQLWSDNLILVCLLFPMMQKMQWIWKSHNLSK